MARRTLTQCDTCGKFTDRAMIEIGRDAELYRGVIWLDALLACPDCAANPKVVAKTLRLHAATLAELAVGVMV